MTIFVSLGRDAKVNQLGIAIISEDTPFYSVLRNYYYYDSQRNGQIFAILFCENALSNCLARSGDQVENNSLQQQHYSFGSSQVKQVSGVFLLCSFCAYSYMFFACYKNFPLQLTHSNR